MLILSLHGYRGSKSALPTSFHFARVRTASQPHVISPTSPPPLRRRNAAISSGPQKAIMPWLLGDLKGQFGTGHCVCSSKHLLLLWQLDALYILGRRRRGAGAAVVERETSVMRLARLPRSLLANPMWAAFFNKTLYPPLFLPRHLAVLARLSSSGSK